MLTELSGSATSDVPSGSTHSLHDVRNTKRTVIGGSLRDSISNSPHEKTESSAIDPLSQVSSHRRLATPNWPILPDRSCACLLCATRIGDADTKMQPS